MQTFNRILVVVDGSESSTRAVRTAAGLAKSAGARLTILHVIPVAGEAYSSGYPKTTSEERKARESGEEYVSLARGAAEEVGVKSESLIIENLESPVWGITEYASESGVDLIVTGTRDLAGFKRLLLGSVSSGVVNCAPCSVLVVRRVPGAPAKDEPGKEIEGDLNLAAASADARMEGIEPKLAVAETTGPAGGGGTGHVGRNGEDPMVAGA